MMYINIDTVRALNDIYINVDTVRTLNDVYKRRYSSCIK